jgi:hypothetical protein
MTDPSFGSFVLSDGRYIPAAVCVSLGARFTNTRSPNGTKDRNAVCNVSNGNTLAKMSVLCQNVKFCIANYKH